MAMLCCGLVGCIPDQGAALTAGDGGNGGEHTVHMRALAFCDQADCTDVSRIAVGDTVTWVNEDSVFHQISYGDYRELSAPLFLSPAIQTGERWSYRFDEPGEYEYFCTNHSRLMNMAMIIVEE